ncbi:hypothetical protein ALI22I_42125 [Saccharothrix sp. ALI-22-I]|uniref:hypothetical protein n=1 Tax=Saccharothrix sp. ALI-22-I TaxID=1933778 RepID=UPI00097BDF5E|nr:hypothetical protein [Saccharothrix sp. ALI-22-I]ONI82634.1 hypothetical protein ALI22I_42125 [Saccharothrix sp. ALI-22-I]
MSPGEGSATPEGVPPSATRVDWGKASAGTNADHEHAAGRYGLINALLAAGIDATHIHLYHDDVQHGAYWVVNPLRGFSVVLTDDTESYAGWLEGPWPFVAMFGGPDGVVRTEVDLSLDTLLTQAIAWCTDH